MIQVTLIFDNIADAHATLGTLMASGMPATVSGFGGIQGQPLTEEQAVVVPEPKPKAKRKTKAKVEPEPTPPPTSKESAADSDPLQVLRLALAEYSKTHGFKAATDLLKEFQIKRLPELPEDRYDDFTEALSLIPSADVT